MFYNWRDDLPYLVCDKKAGRDGGNSPNTTRKASAETLDAAQGH